MNLEHLIRSIYSEEGDKDHPYLDVNDIWTIAVGFTSVDGIKVTSQTLPLDNATKERNLFAHILKGRKIAIEYASNYYELNSVRQTVLCNMCYQMGRNIFTFKQTREYIESRKWTKAAREMMDSKWAREDSPNRALRMSEMFKTGKIMYEY